MADQAPTHAHPDGRLCELRSRWVGNPRDGQWTQDYWYQGDGGWRFCGRKHD